MLRLLLGVCLLLLQESNFYLKFPLRATEEMELMDDKHKMMHELCRMLGVGLDEESIGWMYKLVECGADPDDLVRVLEDAMNEASGRVQ